jgi:signal transduction histidine kinase
MGAARAWSVVRANRDELIVASLLVLGAVDLWVVRQGFHGGEVANALYIAATAVPLLWRRTAPAAATLAVVFGTMAGIVLLYGLRHQPPIEPYLAMLISLYSVAAYATGRRLAVVLAAVGLPYLVLSIAATAAGANPNDIWPAYLFFLPTIAVGRIVHTLRVRTLELELEREERARLAVIEERSRVAHELHDVVAHAVSVMVVQAAAERRARRDAAPETVETLAQIERTGREALVELRRLLGVLRRPEDDPDRLPQPGLGALDVLVTQVGKAGLPVALRIEGEPVALAAGVDLSAFRIVQEALTNTLKHAGAQRAEVTVRFQPRALELDVRDDGDGIGGASLPGAGHGLAGMRERVALHGGDLATGRRRDGAGFEVRARLPYGPAAS